MFDLTGKNALITGASGGIGGEIAKALHAAGATVALSGTRVEPLEALAAELPSILRSDAALWSVLDQRQGRLVLEIFPLGAALPEAPLILPLEALPEPKGPVVLVGDAAHSINPLAGQGVNLGFADAMLLSELLEHAFAQGKDLAELELLQQYQNTRQRENALMMSAMDLFYQSFSSSLPPVRFLRQLGLAVAEKAGPLKHWVSRYAVGIS